ncbi:MAG: DUF4160 domain-containing protein [Methylocystis silviterrae]
MEGLPLLLLFSGWLGAAHIHVTKDDREAKIWLENVSVAVNMGFTAQDLNEIVKKTREERESFLRSWNDYFAN